MPPYVLPVLSAASEDARGAQGARREHHLGSMDAYHAPATRRDVANLRLDAGHRCAVHEHPFHVSVGDDRRARSYGVVKICPRRRALAAVSTAQTAISAAVAAVVCVTRQKIYVPTEPFAACRQDGIVVVVALRHG